MSRVSGKLYTAEQVRRLDACAINEQGIAGRELMERAGRAAFAAIHEYAPGARRWVIVCGSGNNGGDGYVIARLAAEAGLEVKLLAMQSPTALSGDAAGAAQAWSSSGGVEIIWAPEISVEAPELVVDALLGTGLDREVGGAYADAIAWINGLDCPRIAVDMPSGLNADTGCVMGTAVRAQLTVTFVGLKRGLFTCDGPDYAGRVVFDPLGLSSATYNAIEFSGDLIRENIIAELLKPRLHNAHKGDYGHVLVVGGQPGMSGAPRLAGEAALRGGAGLVSVATDADHARHLNTTRPELMVYACATVQDLSALLARATVLAVGPGLGTGSWAQAMLDHCLTEDKPLVLDADALNLLARKPERRSPRGAPWILTPHPAEAARLLDTETQLVQSDRVTHALEIAERFDAIVVLKGCGSIVADPHGRYAICPLGNPGMATAGSGDVLTGVISAMLAQGLDGWQAACLGVTAHAAAGDYAAGRLGERSLLAGDITDHLHAVLR